MCHLLLIQTRAGLKLLTRPSQSMFDHGTTSITLFKDLL